jgi:hypothetical protein
VRPNSEIVPSEHSISVKILTSGPISHDIKKLLNDRFLVQLSKLDEAPKTQLSSDEMAALWAKVKKDEIVAYKLKVELGKDVLDKALEAGQEPPKQEFKKSAEEEKEAPQQPQMQPRESMMSAVSGSQVAPSVSSNANQSALKKRFTELKNEKYSLSSQLKRLEESNRVLEQKKRAVAKTETKEQAGF